VLEHAITSSFTHDAIEPLAELARQFATCTRWFCPVPGETWPNRNFVHAGTSDGAVDIEYRLFEDDTIFDRLQEGHEDNVAERWRIYFEGVPQVLAFSSVWEHLGPDAGADGPFRTMEQLWADIDHGDLPAYSFIEPFHGTTLEGTEFEVPDRMTNSQHSGNNKIPVNQYDNGDHASAGRDFVAGMKLVAQTYQRLLKKPELFDTTVLVITYDEHGGFFDHVTPPVDADPPAPPGVRKRIFNWLLTYVYGMRAKSYDFTMLGPRVPTIIVSPWVKAAPVSERFDHTSIPRTVRKVFGIDQSLSNRERSANTFDELVTTSTVRRPDREMPDLQEWLDRAPGAAQTHVVPGAPVAEGGDYARSLSFIALALWKYVQEGLDRPFGPGMADPKEKKEKKRARNNALRKARGESLAALGRAEAGNQDPLRTVNWKVQRVVQGLRNDAEGTTSG
jgi:phospholipase C